MEQPAETDQPHMASGTPSMSGNSENPPADADQQPTNQLETSLPPATAPVTVPDPETSHILIAYFTWADNTVVDDPSAVDVDATTSASVLAPGNAAKIADWIQQEIGGDLFSIVVSEPYSSDYDECLDRAADEKADHARPAVQEWLAGLNLET